MISTMQPLSQAGAASKPGFALKVAEARKLAVHSAECCNIGGLFLPVVVETLGSWSPDSIALISRIGKLVDQRLGTFPATAIKHPSLSSSGNGMEPYGLATYPFTLLGWMGTSNFSFVCLVQYTCVTGNNAWATASWLSCKNLHDMVTVL